MFLEHMLQVELEANNEKNMCKMSYKISNVNISMINK